MRGHRARRTAVAAVLVLVLPLAAAAPATPATSISPAPVLEALDPGASAPTPAGLGSAVGPLLAAKGFGAAVAATVVDAQTGRVLLRRDGTGPHVPASVAKLATAAAALRTLGPATTLATRVVRGGPAALVLVGGGDATLTGATSPGYPRWASLAALADATAAAVGRTPSATPAPGGFGLAVDDSLFTGPGVSPDWKPDYVSAGEVAPVSALAADHGLLRPGTRDDRRAGDPALAAGETLAALLRRRGVAVRGPVTRAPAPARGQQVAEVRSPPIATVVEHMLQVSDNDVAEALARLAALADGRPASFAGAGAVTTREVTLAVRAAGAPPQAAAGVRLLDGSGLARGSRLTSDALALLLSDAARPDEGRPLSALLSGLPVAGFSGTLASRYALVTDRAGSGVVRAKTGSLTGVSSLAGQVVDADGRLLSFAVLADRVRDPAAARAALDRVAATLGRCGCP